MRIVSLLPSATEIVCALGLTEALVGITHECDYSSDLTGKPVLTASRIHGRGLTNAEIDHAVSTRLGGHEGLYTLDEARLRALQPDLVLTQELCDVCAVSYTEVPSLPGRLESWMTSWWFLTPAHKGEARTALCRLLKVIS